MWWDRELVQPSTVITYTVPPCRSNIPFPTVPETVPQQITAQQAASEEKAAALAGGTGISRARQLEMNAFVHVGLVALLVPTTKIELIFR